MSATASEGGIEEVIVSARRREESIQTTPVAVTAITTSQLDAAAVGNIGALQGAAPNLLITQQPWGAAAANVSIAASGSRISRGFDPAVGISVEGVYIGTSKGQFLDYFDIAAIEVLRGRRGTLFGRNTIAGVIDLQRPKPTGEWAGR